MSIVEVDPRKDTTIYRGGKDSCALHHSTNLRPDPFLKLRRADACGGLYKDGIVFVLLQTKHVPAGVHGQRSLHEQAWYRLEGNMRSEILVEDLLLELLGQLIMQLSRFLDNGSVILDGRSKPYIAGRGSAT